MQYYKQLLPMVHHCLIHAFQNQSTNAFVFVFFLEEPKSLKMFHLYMVKKCQKKLCSDLKTRSESRHINNG